jgi:hypothetical protein
VLSKERDEVIRVNNLLRKSLAEKCYEIEYQTKKHENEGKAMLLRKDQLIREVTELKDSRDDLQRKLTDRESKLELANERISDA